MKRYVYTIFLFAFSCSFLAKGQTFSVKSLSEEDSKILVREGWELVYSSDQLQIGDFEIHKNGIIISTYIDDKYQLTLLNKEHLVEKEKIVAKFSKFRVMAFPYFFNSGNQVVFGPCDKFYYEINMGKYRIRRNRYPLKKLKSKDDRYFHPSSYFEGSWNNYHLGAISSFSRKDKVQYQYLLDYSLQEIDTVYKLSFDADMMTFNALHPILQFDVSNDENQTFILDNKKGLLTHILKDGSVRETNLLELDISKSGLTKSFNLILEKDVASDQVYLINAPLGSKSESKIFLINNEGGLELIENEKFKSISRNFKIHNGKIYDLFKIEGSNKRAIYSIEI